MAVQIDIFYISDGDGFDIYISGELGSSVSGGFGSYDDGEDLLIVGIGVETKNGSSVNKYVKYGVS